jgi:DNA-binding transcriptional MerR regulator/methylmalonyl-CoA mutase cobalamin-binding subunit
MDKKPQADEDIAADRAPVNISSVERDTGLSKDALRVWERRYGFPQPYRDAHGERIYPSDQVDKLRLLKRLLDQGHRPSKIIDKSVDELNALCNEAESPSHSADVEALLNLVRSHKSLELRQMLSQNLLRDGLQKFVLDIVLPLNRAIGNAWVRGELAVFEEHLYSEQVQGLLRNAIASIQLRGHSPRVLLTTLPGEQHGMGLLMAEALLTLEGVYCVPLGVETPATDIVAAALAHDVDIVTISFSSAFPARLATGSIRELREMLPARMALWVGGDAMLRARTPGEGIEVLRGLDQIISALGEWRARLSD